MTDVPADSGDVTISVASGDYVPVLILSGVLAVGLGFLMTNAPIGLAVGFIVPVLIAAFGVKGMLRPRQTLLTADALTIKPVFGKPQTVARHSIVGVEEIITPPQATLIVRYRRKDGKIRGLTIANRIVAVDGSVRDKGRTVGILSSNQRRVVEDWAGLEPRV